MIGGETIVHATIGNMVFLGLTQDVPKGSLTSGVEIVAIMESNCRGKRAGLREGDVIVEIGGQEVKTARDAEKLIDQAPVGEKMEIVVMRNDNNRKTMKVKPSAKLGKIPNEANEANAIPLLRLIDWIRSSLN
jgi:S1-C subfamily serine protease